MGDEFLSGLVMRGQVAGNVELDDSGNRTFRLLLASERTGSIPLVSEDDASWTLAAELQAAISVAAQELANPLQNLRRAWQPVAGDSEWEQVAPSLVVGWLLGHVGALQFLRAAGLTDAAINLGATELEQSVSLSFFRVSETDGVAHLLGGPYNTGWYVRQILNQPAALSTLGSADVKGELLMYTEGPLRLLNAYREENRRAFYPSTYRLTLPILSAASLQAMAEPLALVSRQLGTSWSRLISVASESLPASEITPGRWLRFYCRCVGEMTSLWLEQQLLPPVVPFQLDQRAGWFGRRRQTQTEQQPPCGLCFWRDVEGMWQVGQTLA